MSEYNSMKSFINTDKGSDFPVQNIPFGIFKSKNNQTPRAGSAIGDYILDLSVLQNSNLFSDPVINEKKVFSREYLNDFMSLGKTICNQARKDIQNLLDENNPLLRDNEKLRQECLIPVSETEMCMPVNIGDYTDFYSSKQHATNVGIMFRGKENALMPNWLHIPVAYHGRASSVVLSGTDIVRPKGQTKADDADLPAFGPTKLLDFELEMGFFVGKGNDLGNAIDVNKAGENIFGMVLVNDWSARDIQKWEYVPLGPFLAKNFATSISPWIVTLDALEPFKTKREEQIPEVLPYLKNTGDWLFDINLEVKIKTKNSEESFIISRSNSKYLYWDICQQLAHHSVSGCNMRTGDLLASGTISGPEKNSFGSLLELTWRGSEPLKFSNGEERKFLQDGDTLIISGFCEKDGVRIGFGEVSGKILPAH
ncbi:MAG: fumarylacetoacetase [Ignavibacteria bacterium]|jgi:fumarylacetoacetase|nr:fumarylacetoacetase [Ignavibacteria bacterium]